MNGMRRYCLLLLPTLIAAGRSTRKDGAEVRYWEARLKITNNGEEMIRNVKIKE